MSAAQLAADQAAVDAAQAQVEVARQDLDQAVLTSPFDGVVASVGLTVGSTATAGSTSSAIEVIDPDAHSVTLAVDVTKVPLVKVGQHATVVPDGTDDQLVGTVSYVAAAPATSGGTTVPGDAQSRVGAEGPARRHPGRGHARRGAGDRARGPHVRGRPPGRDLVRDRRRRRLTRRQLVSVGAVGPDFTEVTQGLTAGQQVVLANVDEPIPTSTLTGRFGRFAGAGGLGGLGGGGFTGGGAAPGPWLTGSARPGPPSQPRTP